LLRIKTKGSVLRRSPDHYSTYDQIIAPLAFPTYCLSPQWVLAAPKLVITFQGYYLHHHDVGETAGSNEP